MQTKRSRRSSAQIRAEKGPSSRGGSSSTRARERTRWSRGEPEVRCRPRRLRWRGAATGVASPWEVPRREMISGLLQSRVRDRSHRALTIRAHDAFLGEEPRVDVATAVRTFSDEVLLLHRILRDELVARPVDGALAQAFIKRLAEELLRLEPRLPESLRHDVHLDSSLGLRPARDLDDVPLATPLSYPDRDRDHAWDDRDRAAQEQEERDVVQQDDEEEAEEQGEAAHREVCDRVEIEQARSARGHVLSDETAVLQSGDVRITETHGSELAACGWRGRIHAHRTWRELRGFADEDQSNPRDPDQAEGNHREGEGPQRAGQGASEDRADDQPRPEDDRIDPECRAGDGVLHDVPEIRERRGRERPRPGRQDRDQRPAPVQLVDRRAERDYDREAAEACEPERHEGTAHPGAVGDSAADDQRGGEGRSDRGDDHDEFADLCGARLHADELVREADYVSVQGDDGNVHGKEPPDVRVREDRPEEVPGAALLRHERRLADEEIHQGDGGRHAEPGDEEEERGMRAKRVQGEEL